jgi:hypothetical protein
MFVRLEGAVLGNDVTVVVNGLDTDSTTPHCCKSDKNKCYCVGELLEFKF